MATEKSRTEYVRESKFEISTAAIHGDVDTTSVATVTNILSGVSISTIKLTVNGRPYHLQVQPNWPLRDVLREKLGLTSIKDFCNGYGACGSCTIIMNGRPVLSCMLLAIECDGAIIETAEGIADAKHPLIEAYIMNWTAQCGYCTPGFLVTAKALLDHNSDPTVDEIKEALSGPLGRVSLISERIRLLTTGFRYFKG